jgi:hypothetical protein
VTTTLPAHLQEARREAAAITDMRWITIMMRGEATVATVAEKAGGGGGGKQKKGY